MNRCILNPVSLFFVGAALGVFSKLLDIFASPDFFISQFADTFSDLPVWVLFGVLISIYSPTKGQAMLNIFPFCIGMLPAYYLTAELAHAVYGWSFIYGWLLFSCLSPLFAAFVWLTKEPIRGARLLSCAVLLVTAAGGYVLTRHFTILDLLLFPVIAYFLFIKKVPRIAEEYKMEK